MSEGELLHAGLLAWAERTPLAPAVRCGDQALSYGELAKQAKDLAATLVERGLRPGDRVGLLLPKSVDAVTAVLAVLLAGGVYLPVDSQSPPARQKLVLEDGDVRGVIAPRRIWKKLESCAPSWAAEVAFVLDEGLGEAHSEARAPSLPSLDASAPAYLLYTSGSTGRPKGVLVSHRGAVSFVNWAIDRFCLDRNERLANHAQLSFDLSVLDVFGALSSGASVELIPPELALRPGSLVDLLATRGVTLWYSVPSALTLLVDEGELSHERVPSLRQVLYAGEPFPVPALRRAMHRLPGTRFHNLFGPTETNVCAAYTLPTIPEMTATSVPVGHVCPHLSGFVLDDTGRRVPHDTAGELCIAGPSVMIGYFGRPELNERAFWPEDPGSQRPRCYRTGDQVRQNASGLLHFLGRADRQIKRRGYRIELGEVEAAISRLGGVAEVAVVHDGENLHAVVVPRAEASLSPLALKLHCGTLLPPYMIPRQFELRTSLPRTTTGKIDYGALR